MFSKYQYHIRASASIQRLWTQKVQSKYESPYLCYLPRLEHYSVDSRKLATPFAVSMHPELHTIHQSFMSSFPMIRKDLIDYVAAHDSSYASNHFAKALEYNVPHGKQLRSLIYIMSVKQMTKENNAFNSSNLHLAYVVAWCIEMLQASILIVDDIIDGSEMRRNQLCWYKMENVDALAINDAMMIENGVYYILKKYASHMPNYANIMELFHETTMATTIGQLLDMKLVSAGVTKFTMDLHQSLSNHKTSHFAFYFPIALATLSSHGSHDRNELIAISNEIGHFYQVQNDFYDCFGGTVVLKKPGSDIEDGKCTWLAVKALEIGSSQQRDVLKECYGKNDMGCVEQVRQVYEDLDLPKIYREHECEAYDKIRNRIESTAMGIPKDILYKVLNIAFNRSSQ